MTLGNSSLISTSFRMSRQKLGNWKHRVKHRLIINELMLLCTTPLLENKSLGCRMWDDRPSIRYHDMTWSHEQCANIFNPLNIWVGSHIHINTQVLDQMKYVHVHPCYSTLSEKKHAWEQSAAKLFLTTFHRISTVLHNYSLLLISHTSKCIFCWSCNIRIPCFERLSLGAALVTSMEVKKKTGCCSDL